MSFKQTDSLMNECEEKVLEWLRELPHSETRDTAFLLMGMYRGTIMRLEKQLEAQRPKLAIVSEETEL